MSTATPSRWTPQEYLAFERGSDCRHDYLDGQIIERPVSSWWHSMIKENLSLESGIHPGMESCHVLTSDLRVKVSATGLYTYPDVVIVCDEPQFEDSHSDTLLNPKVIVEVLADSTEEYDRGSKFANYRQLPSMREYVLIAQDRALVEQFVRQPDDSWRLTVFDDPAGRFAFATVPVEIPLSAIYRGVTLSGRENPKDP